ncbi:MAG: N-acetylglucosamine-6-phosphate deacetylase [Ilumatobacter coccineus]|uniref:N-acetylglucosamine-6-phosphate deacetylase n=1 Tax=Ilumatobacter coccineus TaxID=467094 RepID=A0A2G6KC47_9ACTN|nr:MAG: N-acetylglucosamine-6-phosphate deacetylase [Ilumatobacter coccineus]
MTCTVSGTPIGADTPVTITIQDDRIVEITDGGDPSLRLAPGLVDTHCHGGGGHEFGIGDTAIAAGLHHRSGTTTVIASLVTATANDLSDRITHLVPSVADQTIGGIHLEGPFLSSHHCGAQDPAALADPSADLTRRWIDEGQGGIKMMTIAPELPGAGPTIAVLNDHEVRVALGHTAASADQVNAAIAAQRAQPTSLIATHLFNGMAPPHHRSPGAALACLAAGASDEMYVEIIADGIHLADATITATFAIAGDRVTLISDATPATGLGDGRFLLGRLEVEVEGRVSRLAGGGSIAGSVSTLFDTVRYAISAGVRPEQAFAAATTVPARSLGLDAGTLAVGSLADILVMTPDYDLVEVWRHGQQLDPLPHLSPKEIP